MRIKKEKIFLALFVFIFVMLRFKFVMASSNQPNLVSKAAILMDNKTGKILYNKNSDIKMYPASTTKIITAILTIENCNLDDVVTASYDAISSIPEDYSTADIQIGEQLTVEQLLQLLLVVSANDAANVLAEYVGGSNDSFISMMNTKVNELGLSNTHFTNAYGKQDENHYTTAYDLAIIMKYCIRNSEFRKLAGSASCAIPATNLYGPRKYNSTNELINPNSLSYYPFLTVGKTGFTSKAGDCLVSCSYKNNLELICVLLGGQTINGISTRFSESKALYEYGYNNYSIQTIIKENDVIYQLDVSNATKESRKLDLVSNSSIDALVSNDFSATSLSPEIHLKNLISAPIDQGAVLGTATYKIDDVEYTVDLVASHNVKTSKILNLIINIFVISAILIFLYIIFLKKH